MAIERRLGCVSATTSTVADHVHGDDGIVLRLPDLEFEDLDGVRERGVGRELLDLVTLDPDDVRALVTEEIGGSALFAARFRECAARALLLPRRQPGSPAGRSGNNGSEPRNCSRWPASTRPSPSCSRPCASASKTSSTCRGWSTFMRDDPLSRRRCTVVDVESSDPVARSRSSLLFGYVAQFLYEGDSPLAERRAAALALDPSVARRAARHRVKGLALRDLLDAEQIVAATEAELQRLTPDRAARDADDVARPHPGAGATGPRRSRRPQHDL
jgi:ATP-dependent Lhr-like helicase